MERRESAIEEDLDEELSEEEEEDEEPKLKYQRLGQAVPEILKKDFASSMAVLDKFLLMGTHAGIIYMLDFNGDKIREFKNHTARVNDISVDEAKEFIASCSDDGKVVIQGLYADEKHEYEHSRPVTSVALDPMFSKTKKPRFVTGGKSGQLMMTTKGWFGPKNDLIHQGEGAIFAIKWRGPLIAWANEVGVKIYDCETGERITYIDRPRGSPRPDLYRCCLVFENPNQLLIGWADCVKICRIKMRPQANSSGLPARYVEINGMFQTDYFICGIAPFGEDLVILAYTEEQVPDPSNPGKTKVVSNLPELQIVTRTNGEISSDALSIVGHQTHTSMDYRLEQMPGESMYYIVAPRDIVLARPRDRDDHLAWLLERERYEEALEAAEGHEKDLRNHNITEIGERYLDYLLANGEFDKAASVSPKILKRDVQLWEKWIFKFAKIRQLKEIAPYIPVGNPLLSPHVYEMVLQWQLREDPEGFFKTVTEWPSNLYQMDALVTAVEEKMKQSGENNFLLHSLAKLYTYDKKFDKTLQIYLKLGSGNIFDLIKTHNLFDSISDKILLLVRFDPEKAVDLLTSNTYKLPVAAILKQLEPEPKLQLFYLHHLRKKEAIVYEAKFHDLQVLLYADYDYPNLLDFLQKSNSYNLDKAYEICSKRDLYKELVFILGRMGNITSALDLLINKLKDVKQAIDFVEKQNDEQLWDDLISKSIKDPVFVSGLLENAGTHINPLKLIAKIIPGMEIPGLRDRLVKIIGDYNLQMSLREGCKDVLKADCVMLASKLYEGLKQGTRVEDTTRCQLCSANVFSTKKRGGVVIFFCSHTFHQQCLAQSDSKRASAKQPLSPTSSNNNVLVNQTSLELNRTGLSCPICRQTQS